MNSILKWFCKKEYGALSMIIYGLIMVIIYDVGLFTVAGLITVLVGAFILGFVCNIESAAIKEFKEKNHE